MLHAADPPQSDRVRADHARTEIIALSGPAHCDPDRMARAAPGAAGADTMRRDRKAAPAQPFRESRVGRCGPDGEDAAGGQRCACRMQSRLPVKAAVLRAREAVGPVIDIEQDRVEFFPGLADGGADIAHPQFHPRVAETIPEDGLHVLPGPIGQFRHDFADDQPRVRRRDRLRGAQGETHPEPADEDARRGPLGQLVESKGRECLLRAAEAAVHQLVAAFKTDREFIAPAQQPERIPLRRLRRGQLYPWKHAPPSAVEAGPVS